MWLTFARFLRSCPEPPIVRKHRGLAKARDRGMVDLAVSWSASRTQVAYATKGRTPVAQIVHNASASTEP